MIRNPTAYRQVLLRRLRDVEEIVGGARAAAVAGTLPAPVADRLTAAAADLAGHRQRLGRNPTDAVLADARRWADRFNRELAAVLVPGLPADAGAGAAVTPPPSAPPAGTGAATLHRETLVRRGRPGR